MMNSMISCFLLRRWRVLNFGAALFGVLIFNLVSSSAWAVLRDGGIDPANLGQGGWIYIMNSATNHMSPNNISSVTNHNSLMKYLKSQGLSYVIVKAGTSNVLWSVSGSNVAIGSPSAAFNTALVNAAHSNGLKIFGSNRSWGNDIPGEIAVADYVFQQGADGFIYDAEAEWESSRAWIGTNGPTLAWQLCSTVRSNWPNKFIAHNPFDTAYLHFSFPFKEFGYWCDAVMPQVYHHSASQNNAIAAIHWTDWNYAKLNIHFTTNAPSVINGETIYWTNAIKPLALMRDVYNGGSGTPVHPDSDVRNFLDYLVADPNCVTAGGYNGSDYFRSELHSSGQWANIKASTVGQFPGVVNNIVIDDANATRSGSWTMIKTIDANTSTVLFSGEVAGDTNSFGTNYWKKAQGSGSAYMQFTPNIITAGDYNVYQWHPTRADASTNVPFVINHAGGSTTVYANQQTNAANWTLLGRFNFAAGTSGNIRVMDNFTDSASVAMVDGLKLVFAPLAIPTAPSGLSASEASASQINLAWNDNSTNEAGFVVARSTVSGGPYTDIVTLNAGITNYSDTNLSMGTYYFVVRAINSLGDSANSSQASVTIADPSITSQPASRTNSIGSTATFTVTATGTAPLSYIWRKNGLNMSNIGNVSGATSATLTLSGVTGLDAADYTVRVSNTSGSLTSVVATLTVLAAPSISSQPASRTNNPGTIATFSVIADGAPPLSYQWKKGNATMSNGGNVSGATSTTLTLSNVSQNDATNYLVIVSNTSGSVTSSPAALVVIDPPSIVNQPQSLTVQAGTPATFSVTANGTAPLGYQWRWNGNNLAGATNTSFTRANALSTHVGNYSVVVTHSAGSVTSSLASLVVTGSLPSVTLSNIWNIQAGSRAYITTNTTERGLALNPINNHTLIVSRSTLIGGSLGIYILDSDTGNELGTMSVAGINNNGFFILNKIGVAEDGVIYAGNMTIASSTANFVLYRWANEGATPQLVYSGAPDGGTTARWGDSFDVRGAGTNTQIIVGGPSALKATIFTTTDGTNFTANPVGPTFNSGRGLAFASGDSFYVKYIGTSATNHGFNLLAGTAPAITNIQGLDSTMISVCVDVPHNLLAGVLDDNTTNNSGHCFMVYNIANPGAPTVISNFNYLPISSGTNSNNPNAVGAVDSDGSRLAALDTQNGVVALKIIYVVAPTIQTQPQSRTNIAGTVATFTVGATGDAPLTYQWKKDDVNLSDGGNILGATSATLTLNNVSQPDAGNYTVAITNSGGSATSSVASLTVLDPPIITSNPASRTNDAGTTATFSVSATGSATLNYQWRRGGTNLVDGGNISGAASSTLTLNAVYNSDQTNYDVLVSNDAGTAPSSAATLVVVDPVITSHPTNQSKNQGSMVTFSVVAQGTATLTYLWKKNNSPMSNGGNISGANTANLTLSSVTSTDGATYSVTVTNTSGSVTSSNATLTIQAVDNFFPTVSFTIPSKTTNGIIKLTGSAKDTPPGTIAEVWYRLNSAPNFSPATLSGPASKPNWESPDTALNPGTNVVYAYAVDSSGNHSTTTNSKTFFYDSTNLVTVNIIGGGEVKTSSGAPVVNGQKLPMLVGRPASLTAFIRSSTPETNYVFSNWFGTITTNTSTINFIVSSNMVLTAQFITNPFMPVAGKYNGLFFSTNGVVSHQTDGFITFKLNGKASYSGRILLDGNVVTISGKFDLSGHANKTLLRSKFGKSSLTLDLNLDWSTTSQKVFGTIGDGTWLSDIEADRAVFGPTNFANSFVGRYTMLVPRTNYPAAAPGGFGYGLITNSLEGKIVLGGKTGDGAVLSQTTAISKDGNWPFYVPLYRNTNTFTKAEYRGVMMGWVHFTSPGVAPIANDLSWIKTPVPMTDGFNTNYFYPAGFTNLVDVITSPFNTPSAGTRLLQFTNGTLLVAYGNLSGPTAWNTTLASNNVVAVSYIGTDKVTLTLNNKTGLMKGTFPHANNGNATTTFYGAVMQDQNYAAGVFTGRTDVNSSTNQTGSAIFEGN